MNAPGAGSPAAPSSRSRRELLERLVDHLVARDSPITLRSVAAAVGVSHRTLLHHFGTKSELLAAVAEELALEQGRALAGLLDSTQDGAQRLERTWRDLLLFAERRGPLYFELTSRSMRGEGRDHGPLGRSDVEAWARALEQAWSDAGITVEAASAHARVDLAVVRGVLHDLLLTGDRGAADQLMGLFMRLSQRALGRSARAD